MNLSIVQKLSIASVLLVVLTATIVGGLFYNKGTDILVEHALIDIANEIHGAGDQLIKHIEVQNEDALYLTEVPPIQGILRAQKTGSYDSEGDSSILQRSDRLISIFESMLKYKSGYLKIRFIDKTGQEIVVVGRDGDGFVALRQDELQNKAHRAYVKETLKLPRGSVFLSEINLNREYGEVSLPHTEVLRSAAPVFDENTGEVAGLMLITAGISHELKKIQTDIQTVGRNVYITNDRGGYLLHPDFSKSYGFDLGKQYRIQEDMPHMARMFLPDNKDTRLVLLPEDNDGKHVLNFTRLSFDPSRPERFIAVGITQLYSDIVATQTGVMTDVVQLALVLAAIVTLLAIFFAIRLAKPITQITNVMNDYTKGIENKSPVPTHLNDEIGILARSYEALVQQVDSAKDALLSTNSNLEGMVAERTLELEANEIFQRSIVENIVDGLITIDSKGVIGSFNPAAVTIFGYQPSEVIGQNIKMLMPDPYHMEHDDYLKNYHQTGDKKIIGIGRDVKGLRKDGTIFPMELAVSEMVLNGESLFVGITRDITERTEMDKMKNEFISTVSHELRTPLTSIRGSLGLITGGAVGELPAEANDMLKIASNNTERLLLLINDILDIQKIESGQMAFNFQSVDVMSFLEQSLEENAAYGEQYGVKFVLSNKINDFQVYGDKDRMMQVMANLLSNAAKFSNENDTVEISVAHHHGDTIRISVTDHGPGIPQEFQPKLFDKFTQSDSSDTRQKGGTGLGLSITKIIVEKHGGLIDFVSREGIGTTFYIELPALMGKKKSGKDDSPRQLPCLHEACILIVEDDPDVAALLQRMLAESGFNSDIAYDAEQARQYLSDNPRQYRAITLDLALPGEDGISLLQGLRQNPVTYNIPVVVVSVKADETKRSLQGGAVDVADWLNKPIDSERLLDAIRQAAGPNGKPRVLHVEDDPDVHTVVSVILRDYCDLTWTTTLAASKDALQNSEFDLVLLDIGLPDGSGLDLLEVIEGHLLPPKVVIFSASDVSAEYADRVNVVLMKSVTDNFRLAEILERVIGSGAKAIKDEKTTTDV